MNYCTYCGASLEETANFCKNCGKNLLDAQVSLSELAEKTDVPAGNTALSSRLKLTLAEHKKLAISIGAGVITAAVVLVLLLTIHVGERALTADELLDLGENTCSI